MTINVVTIIINKLLTTFILFQFFRYIKLDRLKRTSLVIQRAEIFGRSMVPVVTKSAAERKKIFDFRG